MPDIFVSSGCRCWDDAQQHPYTFGWQPDYLVEGKILGQYIAENFKGKKVAYFLQNDDFGTDGATGLDMYVPKESVVARQTYEPGNTDIGPQMAKIKASGAEVVASFRIPAYTALQLLAGVKLDFHPTMVVSNVGADAITLTGLLKAFSKGAAGASLIDGIVTDSYLPPLADDRPTAGSSSSPRSTTSTSRSCRWTATSATASRWPTRSSRRWPRPAPTRPASRSWRRSRRAG